MQCGSQSRWLCSSTPSCRAGEDPRAGILGTPDQARFIPFVSFIPGPSLGFNVSVDAAPIRMSPCQRLHSSQVTIDKKTSLLAN